jgi:hypothetical protein
MNQTGDLLATGSFSVDSWKDEPVADPDEDGAPDPSTRIGWVQLSKSFHGDFEGHSTVDMLSVMVSDEPAGYVAIERVSGTLAKRTGRFVLQHTATANGEDRAVRIEVVPRSGSGELRGLHGIFEIMPGDDGGHAYAFVYGFGPDPDAADDLPADPA